MFDKMKELWKLKGQMEEIKKQLDATIIEGESDGGVFKMKLTASQEVKEIVFLKDPKDVDKAKLEKLLKETFNKTLREAQKAAAGKMSALTGGLGLPGL